MLTNNNQSMETVVETFYVEETINLVHDNEALTKWNEKVDELQLAGQREVVTVDKSPVPFLWMNTALIATFETLCPTKADIKQYSKTPIPVEILETVSLCNKEKYFDLIEIWYNEKEKDPVCIGYKYAEKDGSDWMQKHYANKYLIGRWADVKASLDTLVKRAKELFISSESLRIRQQIKQYQREQEDINDKAESLFGNAMPLSMLPF